MRREFGLAVLAASLACATAPASAYTTLFAFGDSLSDAGNLYSLSGHLIPGAPYVGGHFSNGPTWVEDLSLKLGLGTLSPSDLGGTDFAVGGATTGDAVYPLDLDYQVAAFQAYAAAAKLNSTFLNGALYTLDIGANDILDALSHPSTADTVVTNAANSAAAEVRQLHTDGARNLLFYEVPNLGLTPDVTAEGAAAQTLASSLARLFNATVLDDLAPLETGAGALKLFDLDTYDRLTDVVANPKLYGFTNVSDPCWTGSFFGYAGSPNGKLCSLLPAVQNQYLFWDGLHPTEAGQLLTANFAYDTLIATPEATTWSMMLFGFAWLSFAGWRAQRPAAASAAS
jgi:phospholipase/lecithinase/hemolysin